MPVIDEMHAGSSAAWLFSTTKKAGFPDDTIEIQHTVRPAAAEALHSHDEDKADFAHDDNPSSVIAVNGKIADSSAGFAFRAVEVHSCQCTGVPVLYRCRIHIGNALSFSQILEDAVRI